MTRLSLENRTGFYGLDPIPSSASGADRIAGGIASLFDAHLERARNTAPSTPPERDDRREPNSEARDAEARRDAASSPSAKPSPSLSPPPAQAADSNRSKPAEDRGDDRRDDPSDETRSEGVKTSASDSANSAESQDDAAPAAVASAKTTNDAESDDAERDPDAELAENLAGAAGVTQASATQTEEETSEESGDEATEALAETEDVDAVKAPNGKTRKSGGKEAAPNDGAIDAAAEAVEENALTTDAATLEVAAEVAGTVAAENADETSKQIGDALDVDGKSAAGPSIAAEETAAVAGSASANLTAEMTPVDPAEADKFGETVQAMTPGMRRAAGKQTAKAAAESATVDRNAAEATDADPSADGVVDPQPTVLAAELLTDLPTALASVDAQASDAPATDRVTATSEAGGAKSGGVGSQNANAAASAEATPGTDQAERVRFVQRVARAFEAASERGGEIRMRLHPAELGAVRLEMVIRNGMMTAKLETESETARAMLIDNLPLLRERLAEQNIRVERFDVSYNGTSGEGSLHHGANQSPWQNYREDYGYRTPSERPASREPAEQAAKPTARSGAGNRLDLTI